MTPTGRRAGPGVERSRDGSLQIRPRCWNCCHRLIVRAKEETRGKAKCLKIGVCRNGREFGSMVMRDYERKRADEGVPNVRELVMESLKDRPQEEGAQARGRYDRSQPKRESERE